MSLIMKLKKLAIPLFGWLLLVVAPVRGQFTYTTNNGTITITGYTGTDAVVVIPDTITGLPVTAIGDSAFYGNSLTKLTIANSVTCIGDSALSYCTSLTSVTIANSVTSIGDSAFGGCSSLTNVTIPISVIAIGNYAFAGCLSLTNITLGSGVTSIGDWAFSSEKGCPLMNIIIPNSVTNIGNWAFSGCRLLTNITLGSGVTSIGVSVPGSFLTRTESRNAVGVSLSTCA
jgi:hypothetical protein